MIKLFASDLDGTLLNALHQMDPIIVSAIRAVLASGAHFAPATGRTVRSNRDHGFDGLDVEAIGASGAIVLGRDGRVLKHYTVDPAFIEELLRAFPRVCFDCIGLDHVYVTGSREARAASFDKESPFMRILMRGMRARSQVGDEYLYDQPIGAVLAHDICKVNVRVTDAGVECELHAFLAGHADTVVNAPFAPVMFEITDVHANKGEAVAWLARYLGFGEDEVAVYGDGGNDIAMLERFAPYGHAYATANASEAAKRAASEVIGPCALYAVPRHLRATVRAQGRVGGYVRVE